MTQTTARHAMSSDNRRFRFRKRSRRGVAMMEFAIVLPVFLLMIIGMIEFGRAVMIHQILVNAAREGARAAVIPGATNADVTSEIEKWLVTLDAPSRQIAITDENGDAVDLSTVNSRDIVRVSISVPYNEVGVGISSYFTDSMRSASSQMRKE
jgi:Flp pilus assembly protein TadG